MQSQVEFVKFYHDVIQPWVEPQPYSGMSQGTAVGGSGSQATVDSQRIERNAAFSRLQAMADGTPVKPDSQSSLDRATALQERLAAMGNGKK